MSIKKKMEARSFTSELNNLKQNSKSIEKLDLSQLHLDPQQTSRVALVLKENKETPKLVEIDLSHNALTRIDYELVHEFQMTTPQLTTLVLDYNQLQKDGLHVFCEKYLAVPFKHYSMKELSLSNNDFSLEPGLVDSLAKGLEKNKWLERLRLNGCKLSHSSLKSLAHCLQMNSGLKEIYLCDNDIEDAGATVLAESLEKNHSLLRIGLSRAKIGNIGGISIAKCLEKNLNITMMDLDNNNIGDEGAAAFASTLTNNTKLQQLNLSFNKLLTDTGARALVNGVKLNLIVNRIDISGTSVSKEAEEELKAAFKGPRLNPKIPAAKPRTTVDTAEYRAKVRIHAAKIRDFLFELNNRIELKELEESTEDYWANNKSDTTFEDDVRQQFNESGDALENLTKDTRSKSTFVIPLDNLFRMKRWKRHEEALRDKDLVKVEMEMSPYYLVENGIVIFISHKWIGNSPDDDQGKLLEKVKKIARERQDKERVGDWQAPKQVYIWFDYTCVPQVDVEERVRHLQAIPNILQRCEMLTLHTSDETAKQYGYSVWCSLEELGYQWAADIVPEINEWRIYDWQDLYEILPGFIKLYARNARNQFVNVKKIRNKFASMMTALVNYHDNNHS
jgi:Ran GTPase-activating protein (RanGAP) involved in mRNA processing and transport